MFSFLAIGLIGAIVFYNAGNDTLSREDLVLITPDVKEAVGESEHISIPTQIASKVTSDKVVQDVLNNGETLSLEEAAIENQGEDTDFRNGFLGPDPRAPKLFRSLKPWLPTEEQLVSEESYESYLAGNRERMLSAYAVAVPEKVARLSEMLKRGEQAGLPEAELAFARDKIARLQQMRSQVLLEVEELKLSYPEIDTKD